MLKRAGTALVLLAVAAAASSAAEPPYPTRSVRLVVASTSGSGPDILARHVSGKLSELWGQQVIVDNRPGASGLIGAEIVAKATPDGHTLWMATMTQLISTTLFQRYVLSQDFAPVGRVANTVYVIAVSAGVEARSVAEFIAYAKSRPGKVLYASAGQGSTPHLCMEQFMSMAGIRMTQVPYKSTALALTDMLSGQIHATCSAAPPVHPFVKTGKVRLLGVTARTASPLVPGLAPIADTVPGFELVGWYSMMAPRGTPPRLVARINADLGKVLRAPDLQERLFALGAEPMPTSTAEFTAFLKQEHGRWSRVLKELDIRPTQ
jgi:tripartite-type tricarboxylate transporter receptor subunit TctC